MVSSVEKKPAATKKKSINQSSFNNMNIYKTVGVLSFLKNVLGHVCFY